MEAIVRHSKAWLLMSALGQKQTFGQVQSMSALPPKADIGSLISNGASGRAAANSRATHRCPGPRKFQILGGMAFLAPKTILLVLTGCRIDHEKSPSARWLPLSLCNQNFQFAKGREALSTTPLKFRTE
jgi:hypothetical protein